MPTFVAAAIAWVAGTTVTTGILVAAYAVTLLGTLALSQYQKRKAERAARAQFDAAQVDRFTNMPLTVAPRELVVGRLRKGGTPFFRSSVGPFKDTFVMTIALASHDRRHRADLLQRPDRQRRRLRQRHHRALRSHLPAQRQ
jgi:hypothetical protein